MINKTLWKALGIDNPVGKQITEQRFLNQTMEICGVIDDVQYASLHEKTQPAMYFLNDYLTKFIVRLQIVLLMTICSATIKKKYALPSC